MKRPRKRTLLMVLLLLTGGAIINVAVAWGCAAGSGFQTSGTLSSWRERDDREYGFHWETIGHDRLERIYPVEYIKTQGEPHEPRIHLLSGWPKRSFYGCAYGDGVVLQNKLRAGGLIESDFNIQGSEWALPVRIGQGQARLGDWNGLPFRPLWPGFAINTVFYAAILWLLFAAPGFVRRRIRARRGQCPACAYPIGTNPVCTECGGLVKSRKAEKQRAEMA